MIRTKHAAMAISIATANGMEQKIADKTGCGYDSIPKVLHGLDCGRVLAAVDACEEPVRSWLLAGYAVPDYGGVAGAWRRTVFPLTYLYVRDHQTHLQPAMLALFAEAVMRDHSDAELGQPLKRPCWYGHYIAQRGGKFDQRHWARWRKIRDAMRGYLSEWESAGFQAVDQARAPTFARQVEVASTRY